MKMLYTINLKELFESQLSDIPGSLKGVKSLLGIDKLPYYYEHILSSTNTLTVSDMSYDSLNVGHIVIWLKFENNISKYVEVIITHKFNGIVFFREIESKENHYEDLGAEGYKGSKYLYMPRHRFFPAEVLVPDYVDISYAKFPSKTKITII